MPVSSCLLNHCKVVPSCSGTLLSMNQREYLYVRLTNNVHRNVTVLNISLKNSWHLRNPGMLARGSHPIHASADLKLLTNFVLRNQNQNMSHIKSHFFV